MGRAAIRERDPESDPRALPAARFPDRTARRPATSPTSPLGHVTAAGAAGPSGHDVGRCAVRPTVRPVRATGVSTPGDAAETQAEAVARRVRHGAVPAAAGALVAGAPARLPRAAGPAAGTGVLDAGLPPIVDRVLASPTGGTAIPAAVRHRVEPHVGVDLGGVRVLTGPRATAAAASIGARAFTAGSTIVLGRGQSPHDTGLMAHEAAHVAQQALGPARVDVHRATILRDVADLLPTLPDLPDISVSDVLPQSVLDAVTSAVRSLPGYPLLTQVIGTDPLTGAPVEADPQAMLDELLSYGPFGAAVGQVLQAMDALDAVVAVVNESLGRYGLTTARLSADIDTAWAQFSITNGIDGNLAIVERAVDGILADVRRCVADLAERILAIVREAAVDLVEPWLTGDAALGPVWTLATEVFHHDPLRGVPVEAATVDILADFLHLVGQDDALDQMRERGTLQETADWLDTQLATFLGLLDQATALFGDAWAAIQPENLAQLPETLPGLVQREFALVVGVGTFAGTVLLKVIELVKQSLLGLLSEYAYTIPGFRLISVIIGQNPFTGEPVPLTAENLIAGFITLLPGGEATYQQLAETGVIGEAAGRIESAMATLGITPELITTTFLGLWDTLSLEDLLAPLDAFQRVVSLFGEPIARIVEFVSVVVQVVIELILRLMNFPSDLLAHIVTQTAQAIDDIQRDPVGFLLRMVEALKAGFQGFLDNSIDYLMQGLVAWLFRGLAQLGITIPTEISFASILGLVLDVLGLTIDFVWRKLGEHIGEDRVAAIRENLDKLGGAWAFVQDVQERGIVAIWEYVVDRLSTLWSTILSMAAEWALKSIIVNGTIKLLTFLDPTFIMSVVNGCIAFFAAVQSAIEYAREILEIVDMYVSTLASVAKGDITPGAQMVERGLAEAVPVALGFLAAQLGLGNVPEKIAEIIRGIREVVEAAIDWLIEQALKLGAAALNALSPRSGVPTSASAAAARSPEEKENAVTMALEASEALILEHLPESELVAALPALKEQHALTELVLVVEARAGETERVHVEGAASPRRRSRSAEIPRESNEWNFELPPGPISDWERRLFPRLDPQGRQERDPAGLLRWREVHIMRRHVDPVGFADDPEAYLRQRIVGPLPPGQNVVDTAGLFFNEATMEESVREALKTNQDRLRAAFIEGGTPKPEGTECLITCNVVCRIGYAYELDQPEEREENAKRRKNNPRLPPIPRSAIKVDDDLVGVEVRFILSSYDAAKGIIYVVPETAYPARKK
jgi:Domain of unknown function (DUF4157)